MRYRAINRAMAAVLGYFWTDCPLCGQMFGGHEWHDIDGKCSSVPIGPHTGTAICPDCTKAGRGRSAGPTR